MDTNNNINNWIPRSAVGIPCNLFPLLYTPVTLLPILLHKPYNHDNNVSRIALLAEVFRTSYPNNNYYKYWQCNTRYTTKTTGLDERRQLTRVYTVVRVLVILRRSVDNRRCPGRVRLSENKRNPLPSPYPFWDVYYNYNCTVYVIIVNCLNYKFVINRARKFMRLKNA